MFPCSAYLGSMGEVDVEKKKQKEKVYAGRRVWEASDRPWRPFLLPNMKLMFMNWPSLGTPLANASS